MTRIAHTKPDFDTSSSRWRAIVNRDAAANNFVYGVRTTKIYCRPRCPARLARRANVEFFDTPKQSEAAGYRACKRCKPADLRPPPDPHIKLAQKACETIALAANDGGRTPRPTLQDLAGEAGLTASHFHRVFKKVVGVTPGRYARDLIEGKKTQKKVYNGYSPSPVEGAAAAAAPPAPAPLTTSLDTPSSPTDQTQKWVHGSETGPSNWNEFDLMFAVGNNELNGGHAFRDDGVFDLTQTLSSQQSHPKDGIQTLADPFGYPEFVDGTLDFRLNTANNDHNPSDSARSTMSKPSPLSQDSLSPVTEPPLDFDSYPDPGTSQLFDELDWLEGAGVFQGYTPDIDTLDFRDGTTS